jgi:hypothetical protein
MTLCAWPSDGGCEPSRLALAARLAGVTAVLTSERHEFAEASARKLAAHESALAERTALLGHMLSAFADTCGQRQGAVLAQRAGEESAVVSVLAASLAEMEAEHDERERWWLSRFDFVRRALTLQTDWQTLQSETAHAQKVESLERELQSCRSRLAHMSELAAQRSLSLDAQRRTLRLQAEEELHVRRTERAARAALLRDHAAQTRVLTRALDEIEEEVARQASAMRDERAQQATALRHTTDEAATLQQSVDELRTLVMAMGIAAEAQHAHDAHALNERDVSARNAADAARAESRRVHAEHAEAVARLQRAHAEEADGYEATIRELHAALAHGSHRACTRHCIHALLSLTRVHCVWSSALWCTGAGGSRRDATRPGSRPRPRPL